MDVDFLLIEVVSKGAARAGICDCVIVAIRDYTIHALRIGVIATIRVCVIPPICGSRNA